MNEESALGYEVMVLRGVNNQARKLMDEQPSVLDALRMRTVLTRQIERCSDFIQQEQKCDIASISTPCWKKIHLESSKETRAIIESLDYFVSSSLKLV